MGLTCRPSCACVDVMAVVVMLACCSRNYAKRCAFDEPQIELMPPNAMLAFGEKVLSVDCRTVRVEDLTRADCQFEFSSMIWGTLKG